MRKLLTILSVTTLLLAVSLGNLANSLTTYGPTTANDHLWDIASAVRPSAEVSKQQTMVAILQANPEAFNSHNVNGLRAGYTLTIPSEAAIKAIPALSALVQVSAQNSAWMNRVDVEPLVASRSQKAPPFGTIRHGRSAASLQVHQIFSSPTTVATTAPVTPPANDSQTLPAAPAKTTSQPASDSPQPMELALVGQMYLDALLPALTQPKSAGDQPFAAAPASSESAERPPLAVSHGSTQPNAPVHQAADLKNQLLITPPTSFITAATATALIKNGLATHVSSLTRRLDDFLIKINDIDQYTKQRLDVITDEQVAMKNHLASLDKQMQQLRENYLQYSTPIVHRSAFNEFGFWIMGSSVLACLLILIFTLRRRRAVVEVPANNTSRITPRAAAKALLSEQSDETEDEYDYLGSREGIAAKLDLARAYIDMGDTSQARHVLNEVIAHGNEEQRYMARKILSDISLDTVH